ncbi:MAG: hypothetical protein MJ059_05195 [Lachnospiraceae bacterium]|nr:hypothetical protein [Lachnospiraceae bacterium]
MKLFLKSLLANMMFRIGWALLAALCFVLHRLFPIPLYFTFIILGIWVLISLIVTAMLWTGKGSIKNKADIKLPPYEFGKKAKADVTEPEVIKESEAAVSESKAADNEAVNTPESTGNASLTKPEKNEEKLPDEEVFDMDMNQYVGCVIDYNSQKMTVTGSLSCYDGDYIFLKDENGGKIRVSAFDYDLMEALPDLNDLTLKKAGGNVLFVHGGVTYTLSSHPYEPCLYISKDGRIFRTLHNAFDAGDAYDTFAEGETLLGIDGKIYDKLKFCQVLAKAVDGADSEMNFTDAAESVN